MVELGLLGSTVLTGDRGEELFEILSRPKRLALLTFLAIERPGAFHRRDKLAALLWEESDETRARSSLSVALHHLKRSLGGDLIVRRGNGEIGVALDGLRVDVNEFRRRVEDDELERAVELYGGPLLDGFHLTGSPAFGRWLEGKRRRLHLLALDAHIGLADRRMEDDEPEIAARWARRATTLAPYDEAAHRRLVDALVRAGHRANALRVFEAFERRLREELRLEPSEEVRTLVDGLRSSPTERRTPAAETRSAQLASEGQAPSGAGTGGNWTVPKTPVTATAAEIRSVAVLFPVALSGDERETRVAAGVHDSVLAGLKGIRGIEARSGGSIASDSLDRTGASDLADGFGVDALVHGTALCEDGRVRLTIRLLDGATGRPLWADSYHASSRDIRFVQDEILRTIVEHVRLGRASADGARSLRGRSLHADAVEHYLMGNFYLGQQTKRGFERAVGSYQRAIAIDSAHAPAYAGLAMAYVDLGSWHSSLPPRAVHSDALAAATRAVALDSTLAEGHIALGRIRHLFEWDWAAADAAFQKGMELNPDVPYAFSVYGSYLMAMGRSDEAVEVFERLVARDPLSQSAYDWLAWALDDAGRSREAHEVFLEALRLPDQGWTSEVLMAEHHFRVGERSTARRYLFDVVGNLDDGSSPSAIALAAHLFGRLGHVAEATELLGVLETVSRRQWVHPTSLAAVHIGLGQTEEALALIETAAEERDVMCVWLKTWWLFDPLRDEPRFHAVMERLAFPDG